LSACSSNTAATQAPSEAAALADEPVELRILANTTPVLTQDYYKGLFKPWLDEHKNVSIAFEDDVSDAVTSTFQQDLAAGDVPDIIAGTINDPAVISQLEGFPQEEEWVKNTPCIGSCVVDGKWFAVNTGVQGTGLTFYNKTMWAKAGLKDFPKTLDEFNADLGKLKDAGYLPLSTAGGWLASQQFLYLATGSLFADHPDAYSEITEGTLKIADSDYKPWLEAVADWIKKGYVNKDAMGVDYESSMSVFSTGKAALYPMPSFVTPTLAESDLADEIGVFATPSIKGGSSVMGAGGMQQYSVPAQSKHKELAMDLIKFLMTDKTAIETALKQEGGARSGYSYETTPLGEAVNEVVGACSSYAPLADASAGVPSGFADELAKGVEGLYTSTTTPAEILEDLQTYWSDNA
jgi:multiple sugar transport system substrate-binding protein/raffinose/stachyose/melibiose transport system substrate-binding protein